MPFRRLIKRLGHTSLMPKLSRIIVPMDKAVTKLTGGRLVALGVVPSLVLISTGKKSGIDRQQPLAYVPDGDDLVLIGSNWGGPKHPGWSYNLIANPRAKVRIKGRYFDVTARLLRGPQREAKWRLALEIWPAYATYAKRAAHREIRVFHVTKDHVIKEHGPKDHRTKVHDTNDHRTKDHDASDHRTKDHRTKDYDANDHGARD